MLWLSKLPARAAAVPASSSYSIATCINRFSTANNGEDDPKKTDATPSSPKPRAPLPLDAKDPLASGPAPPVQPGNPFPNSTASLADLAARFNSAAQLQDNTAIAQRLAHLNQSLGQQNKSIFPSGEAPAYVSATSGYAELGKPMSVGNRRPMGRLDYTSPDRINPYRLYFPGVQYKPEDLVDNDSTRSQQSQHMDVKPTKMPNNTQAFWFGDFKNVEFLRMFLSESGKILPRTQTGLRGPAQRRIARSIRTARQLALLNPTSKYPLVDFIDQLEEEDDFMSDNDDEGEEDDMYEEDVAVGSVEQEEGK